MHINRIKSFPRFARNLVYGSDLRKTWNWLKYDLSVMRKEKIDFTPPIIVPTITHRCNLRCPTCLYVLQDEQYLNQHKDLTLDELQEWLSLIHAERAEIVYFTGGEPLLNDQLFLFNQLCKKTYGLITKVSTNGILLADKLQDCLSFDEINVSIDAWNFNSYKKNRGGTIKQFEKLLEGLKSLSYMKRKFSMSFLLTKENVMNIEKMLNFASFYTPETVHFHNINPHGSSFESIFKNSPEIKWINRITKKDTYHFDIVVSHIFDISKEEHYQTGCIQPWYYFCFDKNSIAPCCHMPHDKNLNMDFFRKNMIEYNYPSACNYCQRRFIGNNYAVFNLKQKRWKIKK